MNRRIKIIKKIKKKLPSTTLQFIIESGNYTETDECMQKFDQIIFI